MANVAASEGRKPVLDTDVREECLAADGANAHRAGLRAREERTDAGRVRRGSKEVEGPGEKTSLIDGFISRDGRVAPENGQGRKKKLYIRTPLEGGDPYMAHGFITRDRCVLSGERPGQTHRAFRHS